MTIADSAGRTTAVARLAELRQRGERPLSAGPRDAADRQQTPDRLTARERIELLLDPGTFSEFDALARHQCHEFGLGDRRPAGDGVVTGFGTVHGRQVGVFAQDRTVFGGSLGEAHGRKICKMMDLAIRTGCPIIGINDSGGARIQEGVASLAYYAEIGRRNVLASGRVPQISLIMGTCAGGAAYSPAVTDFTVMVDGTSHMFVTGPDVVFAVTGERTTLDELGGGGINATVAGNAHYLATDELDALDWVRVLLGFLPDNCEDPPPSYAAPPDPLTVTDRDRELDTMVPDAQHQSYDMAEVIRRVVDEADFLEVSAEFAPNIICGFGRVEGSSVGVVANQPRALGGVIDIDASEKAARFVRVCDAFNIPLLTFTDVPGYMPGRQQEELGIIRRGAKLFYAYAEATVPLVTVVVRKAYGGGYAVMGSKHLGADVNLAWPTAEIAVMGATGAVSILHRRQLAALSGAERDQAAATFAAEYRSRIASPYPAADRGYVDAVIAPSDTRVEVTRALRALRTKRESMPPKKHGNIPL
ncbi:acyl-CoA carboxylase subunit beta [Parafrankia sp. FMc2]|uniref:acyl-CoA carboxylase subunit beta n=1 Tax=Parafrankia sp. FMc2 TaxID=3233196 RepID=UPI0034D45BEA